MSTLVSLSQYLHIPEYITYMTMIGRASCTLGSPPIARLLPPTEGRLIPARSRLRVFRQRSSFSTCWAPGLVGLGPPRSEHRQGPHLATLQSRMAHSHPFHQRVLPAHTVYGTRCTRPFILLACSCFFECGKTHASIYQAGRPPCLLYTSPSPRD